MSRRREESTQARVPRAALWLLERYFQPDQAKEFFVGDLVEEYRLRARPERGRFRADLWFWIQAVGGILTGLRSSTELDPSHRFEAERGEIKMTGWMTEFKYALRMVLKNRTVTGLAVLTLALGIGSVTTVFNVVQTILLAPLPYPDAGRLIQVMERHERADQIGDVSFTYGNFRDLGEESDTLEHIAAYRPWLFNLTGDETPERLVGARVTARFFQVLAKAPALGRLFAPEEYQSGSSVVIIGHDLWVNRYGADPSVVGRSARINNTETQIVGVMPESFEYPRGIQMWAPLSDRSGLWQNRVSHLLSVLARMRPEATLDHVQQELAAIGTRIEEQYPESDPALTLWPRGMLEFQTAGVRSQLFLLLGAVLAVLLIGCVNVANLLISLASSRSQQFSIRAALGANRKQLIRQSLWESAWIAMAAGAAGLTISLWTTALFRRYAPQNIPRLDQLGVDWSLVLVAAAVSSLTVFIFGLLPALRAASPNLTGSLRSSQRTMPGGQGSRTRDLLVVVEVALAMVLLVGAGLLLHSFIRVMQEDLGFEPEHLLSFRLYLSPNRYSEGDTNSRQSIVLSQIVEEIGGLPDVQSAGLVNVTPFQGGPASGFHIEGQPHPPGESPLAEIRIIDPGYFDTMKIPLLEGRAFSASDRADSEPVMMVSQSLVQGHLTSGRSVDRRLTMTGWGDPRTARVVGVVGDIKGRTLEDPYRPTIYWPYTQFPQIFNAIVVRTQGDPMAVLPSVRGRVWSVDRNQPLAAIGTMVERIQNSTSERRFLTSLVGFFSVLALLLAMIGLYGVISYNIVQRIPEIGLRMALGASARNVLLMVFRRGVLLTLVGIAAGALGAQLLSSQLAAQLFGTHLLDPTTYLGVVVLMVGVSLISCLVPALRALKVDPLIALRSAGGR